MLALLLSVVAFASYADEYVLNPNGSTFAATSSLDAMDILKTTEVSYDVSNDVVDDLCEGDTQQDTYLQGLLASREALVAKREALRRFSVHTPKASQAMHIIQQQIEEITEKIHRAPILYDAESPRNQARR